MNESVTSLDSPQAGGPQAGESPTPWPERAIGAADPRERKKTIRVAVLTVTATLFLLLVGFAAWHLYVQWQVGWIELTTDGPPLSAQVLPETGDEPLGEPC